MSTAEVQKPLLSQAKNQKLLMIATVLAVFGVIFELVFNNRGEPTAWISLVELIVVFGITLSLGEIAGQDLKGVAVLYVGVALSTLVLLRRNQGWDDLGLVQPESWGNAILVIIGVTILSNVIAAIMQGIVFPRFTDAKPNVSHIADRIKGNLPAYLSMTAKVWLTAALPEELLYRGLMMNLLSDIFGTSSSSWFVIVVIQTVLFGLIHRYQGLTGVIMTGIAGFILGMTYILFDHNLLIVIGIHGVLNSLGFTMLFFGLMDSGSKSEEAVVEQKEIQTPPE